MMNILNITDDDIQNSQPVADEVRIGVVTNVDDVFKLEDEWLALEGRKNSSDFFQSWYWNKEFLLYAKDNKEIEPFVLTARAVDNRLVALLPLAVQRKKFRACLTGLTEPYQQYTDMLCTEGLDVKAVFKKWLKEIRTADVDYIHLGQVREDSILFTAIDGVVKPSGEKDAAPFVDLAKTQDFEAYHQTIKPKTREDIHYAKNRLEKIAPLSHHVFDGGEDLTSIVENVYAQHEEWLERMGITSRAFIDDDFIAFLGRFKTSKTNGLQYMATSLRHGDHPIAEQFGFIYNGCYYAYISGWDNAFQLSSPDQLHLEEIIKSCYDNGLVRADFMHPVAPYKMTWATGTVGVCDYVMATSKTGYLYTQVWIDFMRPLAKSIAYKLPTGLRDKIFKIGMPKDC